MAQCTQCCLELELYSALASGICPNCGNKAEEPQPKGPGPSSAGASDLPIAPVGPGSAYVLFSRFWNAVRDIVFHPARFFSSHAQLIVSEGGLSSALAFAVIIQWLASFFNFVWRSTVGVLLQNHMDDLLRIAGDVMQKPPGMSESLEELRSRAIEFLFGAGAIVLTPFTTLLKLAFVAVFVHAAVRFFMKESADRPHSYATTLKILAYASAPWILCVIPGFGMLLAYILSFAAAVIGIREVYRTSTSRAVVAVAFPELLLMVFFLGVGVLVLFLAFNVLRLVF